MIVRRYEIPVYIRETYSRVEGNAKVVASVRLYVFNVAWDPWNVSAVLP